ncbi:hypothetical protein Q3G72_009396 [Acer saccharum]|nr:hypothetical protein Q3G72_009396 [Acer saccharum]
MGESEADQSFFKRHWVGFKDFWTERFSFLENYSRFVNRDEPLPSWSSSDVEQFIASDPIHGPTLKTARQAVNFAITGSVIGAASTAGVAWKYSKSPHGTVLALGAGAVFGVTFGQEVASHWYQLYRLDTMAAQPAASLISAYQSPPLFSSLIGHRIYHLVAVDTARLPPPVAAISASRSRHRRSFSRSLTLTPRQLSPLISSLTVSIFHHLAVVHKSRLRSPASALLASHFLHLIAVVDNFHVSSHVFC